ncbi:Stk1 family PASTA domain-containing Ser/Thr kinase [Cytobacillus gottheilii]|uniref:Stk1 family PASTA domain-containing Ser/Thr kinase n=1 Tax=Cytobacillus gottheilii TaxID=859144 RepID=UPI0009BA3681|nr:Stk1 family PASTA domain-containing Ser/Thr kinase [Cytobacillus gottheilii]
MIGKRISGRYKVLDMIGGGGMANVYLAHDMILDRDVAVKMLRLDFVDDEEFIRRFHREAQSATSLAHPNIVSIYDVGEEDNIYYIVMEYVKGQTLKQYIQTASPVRIDDALEIMKQLTSAISHAHQNHIIHRDIKPHNILIDNSGNIKITDFGIAMALSATSITQTNSVLGSVHYLSPEQARGGMANHKSDIYSLGIVMFELLTGRLPFSGESAVSIALKHLQSETPSLRRWNPDIPQSVENIVLKSTAKDPFQRYHSVEEMEENLATALNPERANEPKFHIAQDDDATKAIPVISSDKMYPPSEETLIHGKDAAVKQAQPASADGLSKKEKKKKKSKWPVILISVFFGLIILGLLAVFVLPDLLSPKDIEVPDVTEENIDDALDQLIAAGFTIGETITVNDEEIEAGFVIKTEPKAGSMAKEGKEIDIYESIGKEQFELQDYVGQSFSEVERKLQNEEFQDIVKNEINSDEEAGIIIEQNFSEGDLVVPGETELEFTVSIGPKPVTLKDLSGYNNKGLEEYAGSTGLKVNIAREEYHDSVPAGLVISQDPAAGTDLAKGSTVNVVLSKGVEELPLKEVIEEVDIPYEPLEEGAEQEITLYIEDADRNMTEVADVFTITENKRISIQLNIAHGTNAGYKIIRDNTVLVEKTVPYPE